MLAFHRNQSSAVLQVCHAHTGSARHKNGYSPAVHPVLSSNSRNVVFLYARVYTVVTLAIDVCLRARLQQTTIRTITAIKRASIMSAAPPITASPYSMEKRGILNYHIFTKQSIIHFNAFYLSGKLS